MQTFGEVGVIGNPLSLVSSIYMHTRRAFDNLRFCSLFPPFRALCIARASVNNGQSTVGISPREKGWSPGQIRADSLSRFQPKIYDDPFMRGALTKFDISGKLRQFR